MSEDSIPENLQECFHDLEQQLEPDELETIKNHSEDKLAFLHFGLGLGSRVKD